jgi:hypothetical protein
LSDAAPAVADGAGLALSFGTSGVLDLRNAANVLRTCVASTCNNHK